MITPVLPTYARYDVAFDRGEGPWLWATDGRRFLDFGAGIAVNALGHAHPKLVAALTAQAQKLWHVSNLYRIPEQERLAKLLVENSFADTVFFTNSGAEALECAIKTARKFQSADGHPERFRVITFSGAFHGRTLATISAGGGKKLLDGFGPRMDGFDQVPFGDHAALEAAIGPQTAAILIEPIQGEGGIREVPAQCLRGLRELCDARGLLLVFDEVQCGMGRTGKLWAHERVGVTPDVMAIAKAIGGGFPLGTCLSTERAAKGMVAGTHGSTYGGNPLATAVGAAVMEEVLSPGFLDNVAGMARLLRQKLAGLQDAHGDLIEGIRGEGLMLGLRMRVPAGDFVKAAMAQGLLTVPAADDVVRILPPLNITHGDIDEAMARLEEACAAFPAPAPT